MTFTEYLIDISLTGIVLFQVRGRRLTTRSLLLPVAIVSYVTFTYLRAVPTAGKAVRTVLPLRCARGRPKEPAQLAGGGESSPRGPVPAPVSGSVSVTSKGPKAVGAGGGEVGAPSKATAPCCAASGAG
jgi:hypothetical protein